MAAKDIVRKRRKEVLILHNARMTAAEIAEQLQWETHNIEADIAWWHRQTEYTLKEGNPVIDLIMRNRDQYKEAGRVYRKAMEANEFSAANGSLRNMKDFDEKLKILLQETNIIMKAADEQKITLEKRDYKFIMVVEKKENGPENDKVDTDAEAVPSVAIPPRRRND